MSMKNSNDTIGNRTRDLPTCSAVPQPTALARAPPLPPSILHAEDKTVLTLLAKEPRILGLTQPLTKMSTRDISWGVKAAGA